MLAELSFCSGDVATCLFDQIIYCTSINYDPDLVLTFNPTLNCTESHSVCFRPIKLCKIVVKSQILVVFFCNRTQMLEYQNLHDWAIKMGFPWCGKYCSTMVRMWGKNMGNALSKPKPQALGGAKQCLASQVWLAVELVQWGSGWWFQTFFIFHNIWVVILPIDFHIFQDGYCTTNQGWYIAPISGNIIFVGLMGLLIIAFTMGLRHQGE